MEDSFFTWIVVVVIIILGFNSFHMPTDGEHTGYVTAIEKRGYIFSTWTAYFKTDTRSSQEDRYCITDASLISNLQSSQERGEQVTLEYQNGFFVPFWQCGNGDQSIITKIK